MIAGALVIKGLIAIGHFAAAHASAATIGAVAHAAAGMSIAQLVTATVGVGFVAGCVTWTADRIKNVQNGIKAVSEGNVLAAIKEFGSLAISADVDIKLLPDAVEAALEKMNLDGEASREVTSWVKEHELEIANYVKNHK